MEVAGQWRRQWAGTAEYGKVTEGGVTRRVARAMEVVHASAPGARMRVVRAAYHSTSGPGVPAASYMLHSSRRVISSGFNILDSPTLPSKPLEISSTPLETSPDSNTETENYKVTEPDDTDISEPSKWRGTTNGGSIRMPSEESSSTDNASIIDLDPRHKNLLRKYSYDSENSDILTFKKNSSSRESSILDAPVTLSTLKYKSLLNNSNDWNNRRKSYSFEDTSPLSEIMEQSNDTFAMESSTDSGICKSSEIVNDCIEDFMGKEKKYNILRDELTDHIQQKIRPNNFYRGPKLKSYHEHNLIEDLNKNNISLQSTGKLTITVPITIEGQDDINYKRSYDNDDGDRRVKKVEFCKTELHFAAESGRVNIIATDEKPPPNNDFRKRRSAFVPLSKNFEKPITLFGEKNDLIETTNSNKYGVREFSEPVEFDENTAATKSILKNKIPKPKPYLLGENMAFGEVQELNETLNQPASLGVSLINKELETQRITHSKDVYNIATIQDRSYTSLRTDNKSPIRNQHSKNYIEEPNVKKYALSEESKSNSIRLKLNALSPAQKPKTRLLRDSDLTYFGIDNNKSNENNKNSDNENKKYIVNNSIKCTGAIYDDAFESVRLIKQYSNSAQNSEAESDDYPDYQNLPIKTNFAPVPTPRTRVNKYNKTGEEFTTLKPIIEQVYDSSKATQESRRSRSRKPEGTPTSRSLSEPVKHYTRENAIHSHTVMQTKKSTPESPVPRINRCKNSKQKSDVKRADINSDYESPVYSNFVVKENNTEPKHYEKKLEVVTTTTKNKHRNEKSSKINRPLRKEPDTSGDKKREEKKDVRGNRTEKLSSPENPKEKSEKCKDHSDRSHRSITLTNDSSHSQNKKEHRNDCQQRSKANNELKNNLQYTGTCTKDLTTKKLKKYNEKSDGIRVNGSVILNSADYRQLSKELRPVNKASAENGHRPSRRSEYIIKYDDKNGTVSSISKVRGGHSSSRKKHTSNERNKEISKDIKAKKKHENSALLQLPDHRIVNGRKEDKKYTKVSVQRTCQLL